MMGARDAINDWLEKRRRKARAEGKAERTAEVVAWNDRRLAAEANNEPFDEPIPGTDNQRPHT